MKRFLPCVVVVISLMTISTLAFFSSPLCLSLLVLAVAFSAWTGGMKIGIIMQTLGLVPLLYFLSQKSFLINDVAELVICLLEGSGAIYLINNIKKLKLNSTATATATASDLENQKMMAISQLAGGIAHDFNNLLMIILSSCEIILMDIKNFNILHQRIQSIMTAGQQAATLTSQLLTFSKKAIVEPKQTNINEVIIKQESALRRLIGKDISLIVQLAEDLNLIMIDFNQISQILFNLSENARDAMLEGGNLMIETENINIDQIEYVKLTVADTGCGMSNEIKTKIFEPFFTTKSCSQGLGLSAAYGIAKQNCGYIEVESNPNDGSNFNLFFPICSKHEETFQIRECPPKPRRQAHVARGTVARGTETILVAEDQYAVGSLVSQILSDRGYHVISATNGLDGHDLALQQEKIDLLLTDIVMPNMNGLQLADKIIKQFPQIKIIFMTGYTNEIIYKEDFLVLQKPFTPLTLLTNVRKSLDGLTDSEKDFRSLQSFEYKLDQKDKVVWVSDKWLAFARENGSSELDADSVLGKSLWDFIADESTRHFYRDIFRTVRLTDNPIVLPFRCDSPTLRRFMRLEVRHQATGDIDLKSILVKVEPCPRQTFFDSETPLSSDRVTMCSCCKSILVEPSGWLPVEAAASQRNLRRANHRPQIRYEVCPACSSMNLRYAM